MSCGEEENNMESKAQSTTETVKDIIKSVRETGDNAVRYYTEKFDNLNLKDFEVKKDEISRAYKSVSKETLSALKLAKKNIELFARKQMGQFRNFELRNDGFIAGQKVIPIERVGAYVPGGNYPLLSTALMCVIPAKVAGVKEVIVCSPKIKPETIVAADIAGAGRIFKIGGAQAVAAMAYGTKTIPKVDKIVGPGNVYVTEAKKQAYGDCGIDFLAGPSEVMIIADKDANPQFIAADLLAQLEHDANSRAFLVSDSIRIAEETKKQMKLQMDGLKTKNIIKNSLKNFKAIHIKKIEDSIKIANEIAPEHLELQIANPEKLVMELRNYGSLFIGPYSAEAFGDYCSGTNHVLPTRGGARFTSGLSVRDFVKLQTYQRIDEKGARILAKAALQLSKIEGLDAHNKSISIRLNK